VIKSWLKASLVLHTRQIKEDNGKTKNIEQYGVHEGSAVGVHLMVTVCLQIIEECKDVS